MLDTRSSLSFRNERQALKNQPQSRNFYFHVQFLFDRKIRFSFLNLTLVKKVATSKADDPII
jgi:hypothetical protein